MSTTIYDFMGSFNEYHNICFHGEIKLLCGYPFYMELWTYNWGKMVICLETDGNVYERNWAINILILSAQYWDRH